MQSSSWKTTTLGVLSIIAALAHAAQAWLNGTPVDVTSVIAAVMAGWGLIHAADAPKP
jgi:hypothetical protein